MKNKMSTDITWTESKAEHWQYFSVSCVAYLTTHMTIVCRHGTLFVALDQGVDVDINSYKICCIFRFL